MTRIVTVFGGSGFIGRRLVRRLAGLGARVRVAVRDPEAAAFLKPMGDVGQIVPMACDITKPDSLPPLLDGAEWAVNLVGILHGDFEAVQAGGAGNVAKAAAEAGVAKLAHMSALGADKDSPAAYARTKAKGEEAVLAAFPKAAIFRPSVVFGPEDGFFNRFAVIAKFSPFLPVFTKDGLRIRRTEQGLRFDLFGSGGPKFQPVHVVNVAEAIMKTLEEPGHEGRIYELGGPRVYTMKEIMELVIREAGRRALLLPLPFWVGRLQGAFLQYLPNPPLTPDQMRLLERDNVVSGAHPGFKELGIEPDAAEGILPTYFYIHRPGGKPPRLPRGRAE